ncbi:hypothetical protein ACT3UJ_06295 [Halomonas sp. 86]|uniref:hypothetical protein n=1 Tax=unclassified Halomonas TaxID=2609666 RepID=UPI0040349C56
MLDILKFFFFKVLGFAILVAAILFYTVDKKLAIDLVTAVYSLALTGWIALAGMNKVENAGEHSKMPIVLPVLVIVGMLLTAKLFFDVLTVSY